MTPRGRVLEEVRRTGLDAVVAVTPENVFYVGGVRLLIQRLIPQSKTFMLLTANDRGTLIVPWSDLDHARRDSTAEEVVGFDWHTEDSTETLGRLLREQGLGRARIGIEEAYLSASEVSSLRTALPQSTLVAGDGVFRVARTIKLPHEVDLLRQAELLQERAISAAMTMSGAGDTEIAMANRIASNMCLHGAQAVDFVLLATALNSTVPHLPPSEYRAAPGDVVHLDCGGQFSNYRSDLSRNVGIGDLPQTKRDTYARLWDVQREVVAFLRPGIRVSDAVAKYMELMSRHKMTARGPYLGHGVGLSSHEFPELTPKSDQPLEAGMVLAIEPTTYVEGDARYDIEDTVVVTTTGCEMLSGQAHSREILTI